MPQGIFNPLKLYDFTPMINIIEPENTTVTSLNLFDVSRHNTTTVLVTRQEETTPIMGDRQRQGERNFVTHTGEIVKPLQIPFFNLDRNIKPVDIQNWRSMLEADTPRTVEQEVQRFMQRIRNINAKTKEKIFTEALLGRAYAPNSPQMQVNYYNFWEVTQHVVTVDMDSTTIDPSSVLETEARAYIIDTKGNGTTQTGIWALCGRQYFQAMVDNAFVRTAYQFYQQGVNPIRDRLSGNSDARRFEFRGITYIEDIYGNIPTNEAIIFPSGIDGMFQAYYAPADTLADANTVAQEEYMWYTEDLRTASIQSEFSLLAANTRPELVVRSVMAGE